MTILTDAASAADELAAIVEADPESRAITEQALQAIKDQAPDFDPTITRYAATTTAESDGTLEVTATTSDPDGVVLVDGAPATGPATVEGLEPGEEVSKLIDDPWRTFPCSGDPEGLDQIITISDSSW